jgi:hypothetical protein
MYQADMIRDFGALILDVIALDDVLPSAMRAISAIKIPLPPAALVLPPSQVPVKSRENNAIFKNSTQGKGTLHFSLSPQ